MNGTIKLAELKGKKSLLDGITGQAAKEVSDLIVKFLQNDDKTKSDLYYQRLMKSIERARRDNKAKQLTLEARKLSQQSQSEGSTSENR